MASSRYMHDLRRYWDANGRRRGGAERGESGQWRGEWAGSGRTEHAYVSRFPTAHTVGLLRAYAVGHGFNDFGSTAATTSTNDGRRESRESCLSHLSHGSNRFIQSPNARKREKTNLVLASRRTQGQTAHNQAIVPLATDHAPGLLLPTMSELVVSLWSSLLPMSSECLVCRYFQITSVLLRPALMCVASQHSLAA